MLIICSAFEIKHIVYEYIVLSSLSIFLNSKTNVVTNLNPLNPDKKSISLFLIVDSVSLSYSSGLKEFEILTL